jgi:1-acyl-sn-glycerol-3-phosphate acyltransferase
MSKRYEEIGSQTDRLIYAASHAAVKGLGLALVLFKSTGTEHLPREGRGLIVCNHLNGSDVLFVPSAIPNRHATVVGRRKYMEHPVYGPVFRRWGAVVVDVAKEMAGRDALRQAVETMKQPLYEERLELVFGSPNTRTPGLKPGRMNSGVATAAMETQTPIYPAVIKGSDRLGDQRVTVMFAPSVGYPESLKERRDFGRHVQQIQTEMFDSIPHPFNYLPAKPGKIKG